MVVAHPQEDLELVDASVEQVDDRLCDQRESLLLDRYADPLGPGDPAPHPSLGRLAGGVDGDPVAAGLLGVVHREIRTDQDVFSARGVLLLEHRYADAGGDRLIAGPGDGDPFSSQGVQQTLGHGLRGSQVGSRKEDGELVAPEAREDVAGPQASREDRRDPADQLISRLVAERVVDVLEVVEVQQQQGSVGPVATHEVGVRLELAGEARPVLQAGQRVVAGEVLEVLLVMVAVGDVLHLDHAAQPLTRPVADHRRLHGDPDRVAAGVDEAGLDVRVLRPAGDQPAQRLVLLIGLRGVEQLLEARADEPVGGKAAQRAEGIVDPHQAPLFVGQRHADRRPVEGPAEELLGGSQLDQRLLAVGDVADRARHQQTLDGLEWAQADLDRKLAAVLA